MSVVAVRAALVAAVASATGLDFQGWSAKYKPQQIYSAAEFAHRSAIFDENLLRVAALSSESPACVFSLDGPWADLSQREFEDAALMPPRAAPAHAAARHLALDAAAVAAAPASWDWRDHNAVTPVKDQGSLGTCWAFSAIGNIEGQLAITAQEAAGGPVSLSVEQLVECDNSSHPTNSSGEPAGADCGEFGGWPYLAFQYFMRAGGVLTDVGMPYCAGWFCVIVVLGNVGR
jgi:cathepsin F